MNPHRDDAELHWTPGVEWLAAVLLVHGLVLLPWLALVGAWPLVVVAASLAYHGWVFAARARHEVWRFALVEESVVLFEPGRAGEGARPASLRGSAWITERWVVVRTNRRVLALYAGRCDAVLFARLRRALLAGRGPAGTG